MAARHKNKHRSRHRTHGIKPASLPRISLARRLPEADHEPAATPTAPAAAAPAEVDAPKAAKKKTATA